MVINTVGVVDRIEDGQITILNEGLGNEFTVKEEDLSIKVKEGDWLDLVLDNDQLIQLYKNEALTLKKSALAKQQLLKLRRNKGSKFKI